MNLLPEKANRAAAGLLALAALSLAPVPAALGQEGKTPVAASAAVPDPAAEPEIEPEAVAILKAAGEWLSSQASYALTAEIEYDEVYGDDTRVRVGGRVELLARRPDRFKVFLDGDRGRKTYTYDGRAFVLTDLRSKTWASSPVSGPNDAAVDTIVGKLGVVVPLSDFLLSRGVYGVDEIRAAWVVGRGRVGGKRCHQVLVMLDDLDFQVWIEADGNPVIRKIVLSYREAPGRPQFEATFLEWHPGAPFSDYVFSFLPDPTFRRVELAVPSAPEGKK